MNNGTELSRERIQATERVIRPHIRRTPILEVDGADTQKQRTSFAAEAKRAGFEVTFEQTGEPQKPPAGQVFGVFQRVSSLPAANKLMWRLAASGFRYIDVVPAGASWLVVMPQVPVKSALSIARELAKVGFHIQFQPAK